jgi:integrase
MHADGGGLYLRVNATGARSWIFRYMLDGKAREMGLGALHTIPLAEARDLAAECRRMRFYGKDPIEARRAERLAAKVEAAKAMTFEQCAQGYIAAHKASWKNRVHAQQWPTTLKTYVYPIFGSLPVQAVDTGLVMKAIEPIWTTKPETASRVRGRIETVLDWATVRGYRQGENPARWRGHLDHLLPALSKAKRAKRQMTGRSEHHPALPFADLPAFMIELRAREAGAARALEFAILTAKRTEEVIGARWSEINRSERMWTIPAGRMKGEREHRIPLSQAALDLLDAMLTVAPDPQGYVFSGANPGRPLSNMAMLTLLQKRMGYPQYTVHGFRSTFRDWGAERTNFAGEVLEMALAHVVDDKVEAAYRRGELLEKRRRLMEAWANYCNSAPIAGEIVPIRARV